MSMLIIYATNSGGTYLAGAIIRDVLGRAHQVKMIKAIDAKPDDLKKIDLLVLGSPSWLVNKQDGQMHETMREFLGACQGKIPKGLKFAVYGCGDKNFSNFCAALDGIVDIIFKAGGQLALEPLKLNRYYFDLAKNEMAARDWAKRLLVLA